MSSFLSSLSISARARGEEGAADKRGKAPSAPGSALALVEGSCPPRHGREPRSRVSSRMSSIFNSRPGFELGSKFQICTSAACSNQAAVGIVRSLSYQPRGRMYCIVCPVCRYTNRLPVPYDTPYVGVMARRVSLRTLRSSRGPPAAGPRPRVSCPRPGSLSRLSSNQPPSNPPHGNFLQCVFFSLNTHFLTTSLFLSQLPQRLRCT